MDLNLGLVDEASSDEELEEKQFEGETNGSKQGMEEEEEEEVEELDESFLSGPIQSFLGEDGQESEVTSSLAYVGDEYEKSAAFREAEEAIKSNPFDAQAWLHLIEIARAESARDLRETYHAFLKQYPRSAKHWNDLIHFEMASRELEKADEALRTCLLALGSVSIWRSHLSKMKQTLFDPVPPSHPNHLTLRSQLQDAFEEAISHVGFSPLSAPLWQDYIDFVKAWHVNSDVDRMSKTDSIQQLYERVVLTPTERIQDFWVQYSDFLRTYRPHDRVDIEQLHIEAHRRAASVADERLGFMKHVDLERLAQPRGTYLITEEEVQAERELWSWRRWIDYERSNLEGCSDE
jgi:hypothetical protein